MAINLFLVVIAFVMFTVTNGNVLNWTHSNVSVTTTNSAFIGYSSDSNDIWIPGGRGTTTTLVQFKPATQTTIINVTNTNYGYCYGQCWTQLGEALYMLPDDSSSINMFNLSTKSFINFGTTYPGTATRFRCMAAFDKYLVSVGGANASNLLKGLQEVFLYDITENAWSNGPDLLVGRGIATCHISNNILYVIGGWNDDISLNTVETISTSDLTAVQNTWITLTDTLSKGKRDHRSTVYKDLIYVVGGKHGSVVLKSVDIINTLTQSIVADSDLLTANRYQQIIIVNDILYSFGGLSGLIQYQYAIIPFNSASPTTLTDSPTTTNPTTLAPASSTAIPSATPTQIPSKYPSKTPSMDPTQLPTTNNPTSPTRSPHEFCADDGYKNNGKRNYFVNDDIFSDQDCEFCICTDDGYEECTTIAAVSEYFRNRFMEECGFADHCSYAQIVLKHSDSTMECGCEMFECVPITNDVNTYRFGCTIGLAIVSISQLLSM